MYNHALMLSRPNQDDAGVTPASRLVAAIEAVWTEIRRRHPDVPDVIVTVGAGSIGTPRGTLRLGHSADARWHAAAAGPGAPTPAAGAAVAELFIGGEGLARGPLDVLGTLLHEAAHGVASAREIKDVSRGAAYHNARYKQLAEELGLTVERHATIGWSVTSVPSATATAYREQVKQLREAIAHVRASEHHARHAGPGAPPAGAVGCSTPSLRRLPLPALISTV
jgi:hypothetical protein